jgi:hypothetical protein
MLTVGLRRAAIIFFLLLFIAGLANAQVLEKAFASSTHSAELASINNRVSRMLAVVNERSESNDMRKLHSIFTKTHRRFLKSYVQYSGIEELTAGRFDCLTATSLFADILSKEGFKFTMIETNYHIFIVVNTTEGDVVLETTDRFGGFISDKKKVENVLTNYRANVLASATPLHYQYSFSLYQSVSADQLAGLLFFNQAVKAFNDHKLVECSDKLELSAVRNQSPRISELATVLYHSVAASDLDEEIKFSIMNKWKGVIQTPYASR